MPSNSWVQTIVNAEVAGPALTNSLTATSLLPSQCVLPIPPGALLVGTELHIRAAGQISTVVTTPGNFTFDVRFGSIIVGTSQAMALNTTAQTNATWVLDLCLTTRARGGTTTANMIMTGEWKTRALVGAAAAGAGPAGIICIPETAPAVGNGFDSTAQNFVNLFGTWSVNNASNSITLMQYRLQIVNNTN